MKALHRLSSCAAGSEATAAAAAAAAAAAFCGQPRLGFPSFRCATSLDPSLITCTIRSGGGGGGKGTKGIAPPRTEKPPTTGERKRKSLWLSSASNLRSLNGNRSCSYDLTQETPNREMVLSLNTLRAGTLIKVKFSSYSCFVLVFQERPPIASAWAVESQKHYSKKNWGGSLIFTARGEVEDPPLPHRVIIAFSCRKH